MKIRRLVVTVTNYYQGWKSIVHSCVDSMIYTKKVYKVRALSGVKRLL